MNSKKVQIEHLTRQLEELQSQNNDLNNELMQLRNQSGTHLSSGEKRDKRQNERSTLESVRQTKGDVRMVLEEVCQILSLPDGDPVLLLETIRKLEKVVKAVPRMEGLIQNLSITMSDSEKPLPLEQIMPRLGIWK